MRIPLDWLKEIATSSKEENLFISSGGNILRAIRVQGVTMDCVDLEYDPADLVPKMEDGKLVVGYREKW